MKIYLKLLFVLCFLMFPLRLFALSGIERDGKLIKVRSSGLCYIDPGISPDQAKIIAKYDAVNNMLRITGDYLARNDSLLNGKIDKNEISIRLSNLLDIFVFREGRENIDGYPGYVSYISSELHLDMVNRILLEAKINNPFRFRLELEYKRLGRLFEEIKSTQRATSRISDETIEKLVNNLIATDWANKAYLAESEGLRLDYYLVAIDYDLTYESAYLGLADTMIKIGRLSELLIMLTRLLNLDPLSFPALYSKRGEVYYLQEQYDLAIKELEKAIAINSDYAEAYCVLGSVYAKMKKNTEALTRYKQAIEADRNFYKPYFLRAILLRKSGKFDEALKDLDSAVRLNPSNSQSYFNRGVIHYVTGNFEKAAEEYSKAIYLKELVPEFYYNRSITYRKLDMLKKATEDYKTYLLLTDKNLDRKNYGEMVSAWLADESYNPIILD